MQMLFNPVEKIEYIRGFYDFDLIHFVVTKKYVIKSNGDLHIFYYKDKSPKHYKELHYSVSPSAVKRVFQKVDFVVHHSNVRVPYYGSSGKIKIYYKLWNRETVYRGLGLGIAVRNIPILDIPLMKVIFVERIISNFILKYEK